MKVYGRIPWLLLACIAMLFDGLSDSVANEHTSNLKSYVFINRILLVPSKSTNLSKITDTYTHNQSDLIERKLLVFSISKDKVTPVFAPNGEKLILNVRELNKLSKGNSVHLIGLDGGLKAQYATFDFDAVLSDIDRMPMRRRELNHRATQN